MDEHGTFRNRSFWIDVLLNPLLQVVAAFGKDRALIRPSCTLIELEEIRNLGVDLVGIVIMVKSFPESVRDLIDCEDINTGDAKVVLYYRRPHQIRTKEIAKLLQHTRILAQVAGAPLDGVQIHSAHFLH